jgi:hypothetical protein
MLQGESSGTAGLPQTPSEVPPLHNDQPNGHPFEMPQGQQGNWRSPEEMLQGESSELDVPQLQDPPLWRNIDWTYFGFPQPDVSLGKSSVTSGSPQVQNNPPPTSGTPQFHDDNPGEFDSSWRWLDDLRVIEGAPSSVSPPPAEADTFFNDALKQKLKLYAGAGAVAGVSVGLTLGIQKLIKNHSHKVYVSAFFTSSPVDI